MTRRAIVTAVFAVLAIPTLASAQNVVYACVGNVSKLVRIVGPTGKCLTAPPLLAETAVRWNIQGPPGTPGTNGTNGTNGKDGTNGTNGINGTSVTVGGSLLPGDTHCSNGGVSLLDGSTGNTFYLCNGTDGTTGGGTRAAGPCFDNVNRYVNCQNGTATDTVTGLIWLKQADCLGRTNWAAANGVAAGLKDGDCGLTDGSSPGDWRLPTTDEWSATIARARAMGCTFDGQGGPSLTNDAGTDCQAVGPSSFAGLTLSYYWSGFSSEANPAVAWGESLGFGVSINASKVDNYLVWPVRGGRR
jgi:hypothetical protein